MYSVTWSLNLQDGGGPFTLVGDLNSCQHLFAILMTSEKNLLFAEVRNVADGEQLRSLSKTTEEE